MGRVLEGILILIHVYSASCTNQKHLICKSVDDVFVDSNGVRRDTEAPKSLTLPGKRGPPGARGERGEPGTPGKVDYEVISKMIEEKMKEELQSVKSAVDELRKNFTNSLSDPQGDSCQKAGNLPFNGKCYRLVETLKRIRYEEAKKTCQEDGSFLAEIHSLSQQTALHRHVHSKMSRTSSELWIGMTYQAATKNLKFRSGKQMLITQLQWYPSYPKGSGKTMIFLTWKSGDRKDGLWNGHAGTLIGVICEKDL